MSQQSDKQKAIEWAQSLFNLPNFYVLDTETTGVGKTDEVVQIGVVDKAGTTVLDTLVKPTKPVPLEASRVHGITNDHLQDAPTFDDLYITLSAKLAGSVVIAYNMDFDWRILEQTMSLYQLPMFRVSKKHCAMKEYARYRGVPSAKGDGYRWHKLGDACTYERIPVRNAHSAVGDVLMTLALIKRMGRVTD